MKCCVCGAESGHYPLCRACNQKKEQGLIIKCTQCGQWHYADAPCPRPNAPEFLYECRKSLITANEQQFFKALKEIVPQDTTCSRKSIWLRLLNGSTIHLSAMSYSAMWIS